jgi:hypothetical protein
VLARFLLLLAVIAGLTLGAGPAGAWQRAVKTCACCPGELAMPCCTASHGAEPGEAPISVAPSSPELKGALAPVRILLGAALIFRVEAPFFTGDIAATTPAASRLARLCMRLI